MFNPKNRMGRTVKAPHGLLIHPWRLNETFWWCLNDLILRLKLLSIARCDLCDDASLMTGRRNVKEMSSLSGAGLASFGEIIL
jgi:hypothetical protein